MFEKYNEKARLALSHSRYEASRLGSRVLEPEHVLLGILREPDEVTVALLDSCGASVDAIRRAFKPGKDAADLPQSVELPLSDDAKKILVFAASEADARKLGFVGPYDLLTGILRLPSTRAARVLSEQGLDYEAASEKLPGIIAKQDP